MTKECLSLGIARTLILWSLAMGILISTARKTNADEESFVFEEQPLFQSGIDGYHCYRIPSLLVTKRGTILAFAEARKIAAMAEVYHVHLLPHNPNGPLSTLVGIHLGACTPNFEMLEYPRQPADQAQIFKNMPEVKDGWIEVPEGPGWGVELDEEALARFAPEE